MAAILAAVLEVLGLLNTVIPYVQNILGFTVKAAQEHSPYALETIAANSANTVNSPTFGNAALHAQLTALLVAVGGPQQAGSPVTLPTTPPAGYGADTSGTAGAVWAFPLASSGQPAGDQLDNAGNLARNLALIETGFVAGQSSFFRISGIWWDNNGPPSANGFPEAPLANVLTSDTLLDFLNRESGYTGWAYDLSGYAWVDANGTPDGWIFTSIVSDAQFQVLKAQMAGTTSTNTPPIWPGFANVSLFTPVTIIPLTTVAQICDGVLIEITAVTGNKPQIPYGDQQAWRYLGALSFYSDNGDVEPWQPLAFAHGVYCPRTMKQAAGVVIRADAGIVGTVTPWITNFT